MRIQELLSGSDGLDPSWRVAEQIVQQRLATSSILLQMVRQGWTGILSPEELFRMLGIGRVSPLPLVHAAEIQTSGTRPTLTEVQDSIRALGVRYSVAVLAISHVVAQVLKRKPTHGWKNVMVNMMTEIEIGYRLGARVLEVGIDGGAISGFGRHAGEALLLAHEPQLYKKLRSKNSPVPDQKKYLELFGCEPYQLTAFLLQRLGFGLEMAVGIALGMINFQPRHLELSPEIQRWRAAGLWIHALREGNDYPSDVEMRNFFREIAPPRIGQNQKNLALEVLYTEVAKVRHAGSSWTWHLPRPSYDQTKLEMGL